MQQILYEVIDELLDIQEMYYDYCAQRLLLPDRTFWEDVSVSVLCRDFVSFTEAENASAQRLLSYGTLTGKVSPLFFRSEKLSSIKDI